MIKNILKILIPVALLFNSCAPTKKHAYFKNSLDKSKKDIPEQNYNLTNESKTYLNKGDHLYITVTSGNDEPNNFNQTSTNNDINIQSYRVNDEGYIRLPYIKMIRVDGLTTFQLADTLEEKLSEYIYAPAVSIKIVNKKFTILGEVNAPGEYVVNRGSVNIFQALANAGDIASFGNRKNVLVVRKDGTQIQKKYVDLTSDDIFFSPYFYLQSDDIIYVEPLGRKKFGMQTFSVNSFIGLISSTFVVYTLIDGLTNEPTQ